MRDNTILEGFQRLNDAMSDDIHKLTRTVTMMRTRIDAMEGLVFGSRFALLKIALIQLINPKWMRRIVEMRHGDEIRLYEVVRRKAAEMRPRVMNAPTRGLISTH